MVLPADRVTHIHAEWRRERPDLDVSPLSVIGRLHRLADHLTEELTAVYRAHGLGEGDFDVLATLRRSGAPYERSAGDLAASTMVTTGAMTKRIDRLERAGLLTRRASTQDGRGRMIALTDSGVEVIDAAFTDHMTNEHLLLGHLSEDERENLATTLHRWLLRFESP